MRAIRVWEFPVRVMHWTNMLAIVGLCATGAYIHWPFLAPSADPQFMPMNLARYIHIICAWALVCGVAGRLLWGFIGNKYSSWKAFFPLLTAEGRSDFVGVLKYYSFMEKKMPPHMGHNAVAATAYSVFFVMIIFQIVSGFAMLGQADPSGTAYALFGWAFGIMANTYLRLGHYFTMFLIFAFLVNHIYAMWISDIVEKDGTSGSMFSGYKYKD